MIDSAHAVPCNLHNISTIDYRVTTNTIATIMLLTARRMINTAARNIPISSTRRKNNANKNNANKNKQKHDIIPSSEALTKYTPDETSQLEMSWLKALAP